MKYRLTYEERWALMVLLILGQPRLLQAFETTCEPRLFRWAKRCELAVEKLLLLHA